MLTARGEASDRVRGLEAGVDDYLAKPYEPKELLLRVGSILRRTRAPAAPLGADETGLRFGPFLFLAERGELRRGDDVVRLTEREREILRLLGATPGSACRARRWRARAAARRSAPSTCRSTGLRRKLERDPANPIYLQTARGAGYKLWPTHERHRRARCPGSRPRGSWRSGARGLADLLPKGLYARSLLIVILPMVLLQTGVAYLFMQRHWDLVTHRLSDAVARDVGAIIDLYDALPLGADDKRLREIASERFRMSVDLMPPQPLPPSLPRPLLRLPRSLDPRAAEGIENPAQESDLGRHRRQVRTYGDSRRSRLRRRAAHHQTLARL